MDLFDRPAADSIATVQKNFQEADGPGVVDFDSGITDGANGDEQGEPLQQREVGGLLPVCIRITRRAGTSKAIARSSLQVGELRGGR